MTKTTDLNDQIAAIKAQLTPENADYMRQLHGYLLVSNVFSDEAQVIEQLLQIYSDVLVAQKDGVSAEVFLGHQPKEMVDALSRQFSKQRKTVFIGQTIWLLAIFEVVQALLQLFLDREIRFSPWLFLVDLVIALLVPWLIFALRHAFYRANGESSRRLMFLGIGCVALLLARGFLQSQLTMIVLLKGLNPLWLLIPLILGIFSAKKFLR